jgi:hypothetical protein
VNVHGSDKTGIVHFEARNLTCGYQAFPLPENIRGVRKQPKERFAPGERALRPGDCHSETVQIQRAGSDTPKLNQVLWRRHRGDKAF